ncbi:TPA: hypothetical protein QFF48_001630 [Enterococcus faecium]
MEFIQENAATVQNTRNTIAETYEFQRPAIKVALFVLWRIHNKLYQAGARLFYEEIQTKINLSKGSYKEALAFLEGAGVVVNEVVVTDRVPALLVSRYGIVANE